MFEKILIQNGFSSKEAHVYAAALEYGEATVSRLASKTGLKRTTLYDIVADLKTKGVVSINRRRGIQYVSVLSPQILIERFKKSAQLAEQMLPQLMAMAYASPLKPRLQFFEGMEGIQEILRSFAQSRELSCGFTDYSRMPSELFQFIRKEIIPQREKYQNRAQFIVPNNAVNRTVQHEDALYFSEHRLVDFASENPIELLLFDQSKIAILSFQKNERFGLVIDSSAVYQTLKNIFGLLWTMATPPPS